MKKLYLSLVGFFCFAVAVYGQKIEGKVFDKESNIPIVEGEVTFYNNKGNKIATVYTEEQGDYIFEPRDISIIHKVVSSADNYNTAEVIINQMDLGIVANFGLVSIKDSTKVSANKTVKFQKVIELPFFYYDFNSSYLNDNNKMTVNKIFDFMNANPDSRVRVHVYFDTRGNAKYDEWLADRRASRVIDYLVMKGIAPNRLVKWVETVSSNIPGRIGGSSQSSRNEARRCDFEVM